MNNCAIIISSCDNYRDAWKPFFTLFFRYSQDCPYRLCLIAGQESWPDTRVETFHLVPDRGWSGNLLEVLSQIEEDYVMYLQEDYFLEKRADTAKIDAAIDFMKKENAAYLRLTNCPGPDLPYKNETELGAISTMAPYRNSTQAAIWRKDALMSILKDGETGWDFEVKGGLERSRLITDPFLSYKKPLLDYFITGIIKGKYARDLKPLLKKENISLDFSRHKMENYFQYIVRRNNLKPRIRKLFFGFFGEKQ